MRLDYSKKDPAARRREVLYTLSEGTQPSRSQMAYMADYMLMVTEPSTTARERKQDYPLITKNRAATHDKRQISLEETVSSLQNGEDGLYALIQNDKDAILDPKSPITDSDIERVPGLASNLAVIDSLKRQLAEAQGRRRFLLKKQIISKYQECYTLKSSYLGIQQKARPSSTVSAMSHVSLPEHRWVSDTGEPMSDCFVSLFDEAHVAFLLRYYQVLKQECYGDFDSDMYYLLLDLENTVDRALAHAPIYYDLLVWKIDGLSCQEIADKIYAKHNVRHSIQYFSTLWSSKIPKMVAFQARKDWLIWHYTYEAPQDAHWKICRTCGQVKLAHPYFFSKNASKDGFYSKCRECRSRKTRIKKEGGYGKVR